MIPRHSPAAGLVGAASLAALLSVFPPASSQEKQPMDPVALAWMSGSWTTTARGVETEEHWTAPRGGTMLGTNRTIRGGVVTAFEFLRIARTPEGMSYFASPQARPATEFKATTLDARRVVFENPQHDFPAKITYWQSPEGGEDVLHARVEGTINGAPRSLEWKWARMVPARAVPPR